MARLFDPYTETYPDNFKSCPACGCLLEKLDGDDTVMCGGQGKVAGGSFKEAPRPFMEAIYAGGCGHKFKWSTLAPIDYGRPGHPANERQLNFGVFRAVAAVPRTKRARTPPKHARAPSKHDGMEDLPLYLKDGGGARARTPPRRGAPKSPKSAEQSRDFAPPAERAPERARTPPKLATDESPRHKKTVYRRRRTPPKHALHATGERRRGGMYFKVKEQDLPHRDDVMRMTATWNLPRELLLQQAIEGIHGKARCFLCNGAGRIGAATDVNGPPSDMVDQAYEEFNTSEGDIKFEDFTRACKSLLPGEFTESEISAEFKTFAWEPWEFFDTTDSMILGHQDFADWLFAPGERRCKLRQKLWRRVQGKTAWLYQERNGSWAIFDRHMAATLDEAYLEGAKAIPTLGLTPSKGFGFWAMNPGWTKKLLRGCTWFMPSRTLEKMLQTNQKTGTERRVLRISDGQREDADPPEQWFQRLPTWTWARDCAFSIKMARTLEVAWQAQQAGILEFLTLPMRVGGQVYEFDVLNMTQKNVESRKERKLVRHDAESHKNLSGRPLMRVPSTMELPLGSCWVCRGRGETSQWVKQFDDKLRSGKGDIVDCPVCYTEVARYSISTESTCGHMFCNTCIQMSMEAMMEAGQFPACCPMCRAEGKPENGPINGVAVSFLQQRSVITKAFQFRFLKQQNKALKVEEPAFIECPGKCGEHLITEDPEYKNDGIGDYYTEESSGEVCVKPGACPKCETFICIKCESRIPKTADGSVPPHKCDDIAAKLAEVDEDSLKFMATIGKKCPVCKIFIEKNDGCEFMMCGTKAHGSLKESIKNGGCGIAFNWNNMQVVDDCCGWDDLDGSKKRGRPVTARQLVKNGMEHPKCKRPACQFFKSVDGLGKGLPWHNNKEGTQGRNGGGDYCCSECSKNGGHGAMCHQILFAEKR